MASQHRKPRSAGTRVAGIRTPALATAAFTSVALLSQTANAAASDDGRPSLEEVEKKVGDLYRQAESATEKYNAAKEKTAKQRKQAGSLLDDVAQRTQKLNEARENSGSHATAQYRTGASAPDTAAFLLADTPQDHFDRNQLMSRLTDRQNGAVDSYVTEQSATAKQRQEATESLAGLTDSQNGLRTAKASVQKKLGDARELLSRLTAQEKARLAAIEKQRQEEAARQAAELARQHAAARAAAQQESGGISAVTGSSMGSVTAPSLASVTGSSTGSVTAPSMASVTRSSMASVTAPSMASVTAPSMASVTAPSMASVTGSGTGSSLASVTGSGTGSSLASVTGSGMGSASTGTSSGDLSYATKAEKALAFARAQIGKPYVWGAMGPDSYDCSGLTQAAWKAAGVTLPRTSYDQVNAGTTVSLADARPGDLVFFYADFSHVGVYIGNGMMIHAPKPGAYVREESVLYDGESGIHSVLRPA
ncbi:NlpC/P60 family protein [Streptomyces sp. NPDC060000]|uniref:C40 family peptidase n=1 Tax=Streptomyces sp. NPDC060000 TaxID=3347031 RepID=UPI0036889A57